MTKKQEHKLPHYLNDRILRGVAFLNKEEPQEMIQQKISFLEEEENYTRKEISYILLLLALPFVDNFFNDPHNRQLAKDFDFDSVMNRTIN
jgi:hypothetical protein